MVGRIEEELEGVKGGWICPKWMSCMCEILKQLKNTYRVLRSLPPGRNVSSQRKLLYNVNMQEALGFMPSTTEN